MFNKYIMAPHGNNNRTSRVVSAARTRETIPEVCDSN